MKKIMTTACLVLSLISYSQTKTKTDAQTKTIKKQKDSVVVVKQVDDMEDKSYYYPSRSIVIIDETKKQGIRLSAFINSKTETLKLDDLELKMVGIGSCVENNILIIKFEDETKIELKSWNDFNCEGNAWFDIDKGEDDIVRLLETKRISKIRVQNGRSYESFTAEVSPDDADYFMQLIYAIDNNKVVIKNK